MQHSVTTTGNVADDHSLTITVSTGMPPGPVKVTVTVESEVEAENYMPLSKLVESGVLGAWAHRKDLGDSAELAKKLRDEAWRRTG